MGHRREHDIDVMLLMQITNEHCFFEATNELKVGIDNAVVNPTVQNVLDQAQLRLNRLRRESHRRSDEGIDAWIAKNLNDLRETTRWFAFELWFVPSCVRPVLWRHVWEGRRRPPHELVPEWLRVRTQIVISRGYDCMPLDVGRRMPYAAIVFDPLLATDTDINDAKKWIRTQFGAPATRSGRAPMLKRTIQTVALEISLCVDFFYPLGTDESDEYSRLRDAWNRYRTEPERPVDGLLLDKVRKRVEELLGGVVSEGIIRKTLQGWSPPPAPSS